MKLVARFASVACIVTAGLAIACEVQKTTSPPSNLSLKKSSATTDNTCQDVVADHNKGKKSSDLALLCAIQAPGPANLTQGQKGWVDHGRYYLANQSNKSLDVFDADALTFVGRVEGFAGNLPAGGGTALTNGPGPSSVIFSDPHTAWVSDGNSTTWIVDVHAMRIIGSVNTSIPACDGGTATTHYCGRANEIMYDPEHRLIFVQNPSPLSKDATGTPPTHAAINTYATFINADPPYNIVGVVTFDQRRGQESPVYDRQTHRMLSAVSGRTVGTTVYHQYVAVIDPTQPTVVQDSFVIDCNSPDILGPAAPRTFGINDPSLGPEQHMIIPACGRPVIMNATTGAIINGQISTVAGGNETWYNKGDKNFYVAVGNQVGVIDASSATLKQAIPALGVANPAADSKTNRVFVIVQSSANPTVCTQFGYQTSGCIAVYGHLGKPDKDDAVADDDDD